MIVQLSELKFSWWFPSEPNNSLSLLNKRTVHVRFLKFLSESRIQHSSNCGRFVQSASSHHMWRLTWWLCLTGSGLVLWCFACALAGFTSGRLTFVCTQRRCVSISVYFMLMFLLLFCWSDALRSFWSYRTSPSSHHRDFGSFQHTWGLKETLSARIREIPQRSLK